MPPRAPAGMLATVFAAVFSMSVWTPPRHWLPPSRHWQLHPAPEIHSWLLEPGSLTARLVARAQGNFRVEVLSQYWGRPAVEEARRLRLHPGRFALIREVALIGNDEVWVRARSVLPASSLTGAGRRLRKLGNRSLGGLLFRDPTLRRGPIEISRLRQPEGRVFARRSHLVYHGRPLLVAECFLPALFRQP
ncbi:MAG: chorismate lyase [Pedobacter sp.]|nr:chorismate lyase [Pedobacter sp.]